MNRKDEKHTLPEILGARPEIGSLGEPDGDESSADSKSAEETESTARENLPTQKHKCQSYTHYKENTKSKDHRDKKKNEPESSSA